MTLDRIDDAEDIFAGSQQRHDHAEDDQARPQPASVETAAPGGTQGTLVVSDIVEAHDGLLKLGIDVSDVWHGPPFPVEARQPGVDPKRTSYGSFCSFNDPDGNLWIVQEVTTRLPGRE